MSTFLCTLLQDHWNWQLTFLAVTQVYEIGREVWNHGREINQRAIGVCVNWPSLYFEPSGHHRRDCRHCDHLCTGACTQQYRMALDCCRWFHGGFRIGWDFYKQSARLLHMASSSSDVCSCWSDFGLLGHFLQAHSGSATDESQNQ